MGRFALSDEAYSRVADQATKAGSATYAGEERKRQGLGLHPLVDPAGYDLIRRSLSWYEPEGDHFVLLRGVAMLEETRLDTTGSMGRNVEVAMKVLPKTYELLATGKNAVLGRYDTQMITSIFGDEHDQYILCRSQAEMDERIAEQMTLMLPEGGGWGNGKEDPQYGLFGGAYLTQNSINDYGLKRYDFTISDEPVPAYLTSANLIRVFGPTVFDKVAENTRGECLFSESSLPSTKEIVTHLQLSAHAFFLYVETGHHCCGLWEALFGREYVVQIDNVEMLPFMKAAIIGLTEGVLDLQTIEDFLRENKSGTGESFTHHKTRGRISRDDAQNIKRAISRIPIGAQAALPNFNQIPLREAKFAKKGDLWPIKEDLVKNQTGAEVVHKPRPSKKEQKIWL